MATNTTTTTIAARPAPRVHLATTIALGAATAAVILLAAWALNILRAEAASPPDDATFVPITPCRLLDTRPDTNVGPRDTPIGADETHIVQVTGTNGDCQIPITATAVAVNLTGVRASAVTFVAVYPADADNPGTSALNLAPGQPATPNKIDVKLSPTGQLALYNRFGTTHLIGDVLGYYQTTTLTELTDRIAALEAGTGSNDVLDRLDTLETENAELRERLANVSLESVDGHPTIRFTGVNVQIVDGTGDTTGDTNGRGNLIIGYNEDVDPPTPRNGSHNLVVGPGHGYSSYGGAVIGSNNAIAGPFATVSGGLENMAAGSYSSVSGGYLNEASGAGSSVSGGSQNTASGTESSVSGGLANEASGGASSVSGGWRNAASGPNASVSGGDSNHASGDGSSVSGGDENVATGHDASISGGRTNTASGGYSSVSGGRTRSVSGTYDWQGGQYSSDL